LGGTLIRTASAGIATFTGLTLSRAATGYSLSASGSGLSAATTNPFNVNAAAATQWVVSTQPPSSVTAGAAFALVAAANDPFGNVDSTYSGSVSLALGTNPSTATLGGTTTINASAGVATFSGLTLNKAASGYSLIASGGGMFTGTTGGVTVVAATPSQW